jgi:hypothetical protein
MTPKVLARLSSLLDVALDLDAAAREAARTAVEQLSKDVDSAHPALALARRLSTP